MNVEINHHTIPKPIPNQPNRQPVPEELAGKPAAGAAGSDAAAGTAGRVEGTLPLEENLESLIDVLPEQSEEAAVQPKPQDSFTQSEALIKKNELVQIWKDSYQMQQNTAQTDQAGVPQASSGKGSWMQSLQPGMQSPSVSPAIDWSDLSNEILSFLQNMGTGNVGEGLDYLISRYVALGNQMDTRFSGDERADQKQHLEHAFSKGRRQLVDGYVGKLQKNLCLPDSDAARLKSNMETVLEKRLQAYQKVSSEQASSAANGMKPHVQKDDQYMAAQLRSAMTQAGTPGKGFSTLRGKEFSLGDMQHAGEFSNGYQMLYKNAGMGTERDLAADMALIDMKMKSLINKGIVGKRMAAMLQSSSVQRHEEVMNAADERIAARGRNQYVGMEGAPKASVNRSLIKDIYDAIIAIFDRNGGDPLAALRDGLSSLGKSSGEGYRTKDHKRGGTIYEIDGRGYIGANSPIVRLVQIGRIRDVVMAFAVIGCFFALWYFML